MSNPSDNPRNHNFHAKIISEGYCCEYGYLELCRVRGQTPATMYAAIGLSRPTIYDHYRKLAAGDYTCQNRCDCLQATIEEIAAETRTPHEGPEHS